MANTSMPEARIGALHDAHNALGAKFGDFGGWLMPLEYAGGGVLAEHAAVRESVGVFDVSHMGTFTLKGPDARSALNQVLTNDLTRVGPGSAQYSMLCSSTGGVVDDLIVYVRSADDVFVVPNAANTSMVIATVQTIVASSEVSVRDVSARTAIIAVQGPQSPAVLSELGLPADLDYMTFTDIATDSGSGVVARTGYTGEHGYELVIPVQAAVLLWPRIVELCRERGGLPCGLGARDTLRTEMGYPLHGHELGLEISPLEAGISWAVGWEKPSFVGRATLVHERERGPARQLRGLLCVEKGVPRGGMTVRRPDEETEILGVVTSGTFSPTLKQGVALALLDPAAHIGDEVIIDIRGRPCRAQIVKPPFVPADPRK